MAEKIHQIVGTRVAMLVVQERLPGSRLRCKCDCGKERVVHIGHFNSGKIKSCGCHANRHGHCAETRSREYTAYHNMIARCHKPTNKRFKDYGARGIVVCDRWRESFKNFITDMGQCPRGFTIDRENNLLPYDPENCRWVDRKQNQRNRSISVVWIVRGVEYETLDQAAEALDVCSHTIAAWCKGRTVGNRHYPPRHGCGFVEKYPVAA